MGRAHNANTPNEAQQAWNNAGTQHMKKDGIRRALQIVRARAFIYDGSLAPTCLFCGGPREDRKAMRCNRCTTKH